MGKSRANTTSNNANPKTTQPKKKSKRADEAGKKQPHAPVPISLQFDGSNLSVFRGTQLVQTFAGTSGKDMQITPEDAKACGLPLDSTYMGNPELTGIKDRGPIPEGRYVIDPSDVKSFRLFDTLRLLAATPFGSTLNIDGKSVHAGDWGAGRVYLSPITSSLKQVPTGCGDVRDRSELFLHGGIFSGSSGCIDVGLQFNEIAELLATTKESVPLTVKYPNRKSEKSPPKSDVEAKSSKSEHGAVLHRSAVSESSPSVIPESVHATLRTPGQPLDKQVRSFFEPRFGRDFSHVRIHTDGNSAASAKAVNAEAYTVGNHIVFGSGQFSPGTSSGQYLIAHELSHLSNNTHVDPQPTSISNESSANETAADTVAIHIAACNRVPTHLAELARNSSFELKRKSSKKAAKATEHPVTVSYDKEIESAVEKFNLKLKPSTSLDPDWVKAMVRVEAREGGDPLKYDPMQVANAGDPALHALAAGTEGTHLILNEAERDVLRKIDPTPRRHNRWDYSAVPKKRRIDSSTSITAGVAWLFRKAANFKPVSKPLIGPPVLYKIKPGETIYRIAKDEGSTTVAILNANPSLNPKRLKPGTSLLIPPAHVRTEITGWKDWKTAVKDYNSKTKYLEKVEKEFKKLKLEKKIIVTRPAN